MKKKLISGLFLMLWMALLIAAMVYPQGIFPVLAASGVWVACLLTWAVIPVALAALIQNGPLWQELRASLLKTITRMLCNSSDARFISMLVSATKETAFPAEIWMPRNL